MCDTINDVIIKVAVLVYRIFMDIIRIWLDKKISNIVLGIWIYSRDTRLQGQTMLIQ